jgi:glycosyltransferase involved in cell wall biosynthesis
MIEIDLPIKNTPKILLFAKGGRRARLEAIERGEDAPREFFYGYFSMIEAGLPTALMSVAGPINGWLEKFVSFIERIFIRITGVGARPLTLKLEMSRLKGAKVLISCVDGFSLTLGLGSFPKGFYRIGGFQGFSDIIGRCPLLFRPLARRLLCQALRNLDHVFFLSPADRKNAIENFGLSEEKSTLVPFCVDTEFWRPNYTLTPEDWSFAVGQDRNRDFQALVQAPGNHKIRIHTSLQIYIPNEAKHISLSRGGYFSRERITDAELLDLYQRCFCVIVPLFDVYQPSGQSVTLQAMSCGKPVILTKTRGLWDHHNLRDGVNCIFVSPQDPEAISAAISRLKADHEFYSRISKAARETALSQFSLQRMGTAFIDLANIGLTNLKVDL